MNTITTRITTRPPVGRPRLRTAAALASAVGALACGAVLASAPAQAAAGSVSDANADGRSAATALAGETLWRMHPLSSPQKKMVPRVTTSGVKFAQRTIPSTFNPIYTGELWYFHYNSTRGTYVVENFNGGCLDIIDGISKSAGKELAVRACDNTQSQDWYSNSVPGGYNLVNRWSGLAATLPTTAENQSAKQYSYVGTSNQRFHMPIYVD